MQYLTMLQQIILVKNGTIINSWSDINPSLYNKFALELNNCLQDTWLGHSSLFRQRVATMTCVIGQSSYDMPFNGELKQDGLLLQPIQPAGITGNPPPQVKLRYSIDTEKFFMNQQSPGMSATNQGQPSEYTMFNNQLMLLLIPDNPYILTCLYFCKNWALSNGTVQTAYGSSNVSGQNKLTVDRTQDVDIYGNVQNLYNIGDIIYINYGSNNFETGVVNAIDYTNNVLSFVGNLTFTHSINEAITVERQTLTFATDTPNLPMEHHNTFVYGALYRLLNGDSKQNIYAEYYNTAIQNLVSNTKNTQSACDAIRFVRCGW